MLENAVITFYVVGTVWCLSWMSFVFIGAMIRIWNNEPL